MWIQGIILEYQTYTAVFRRKGGYIVLTKKDFAGLTAKDQLAKINEVTHEMINRQYSTYNRSLLPQLAENGLKVITHHEDLDEEQQKFGMIFSKMSIISMCFIANPF